jgi:hypothetical protein
MEASSDLEGLNRNFSRKGGSSLKKANGLRHLSPDPNSLRKIETEQSDKNYQTVIHTPMKTKGVD